MLRRKTRQDREWNLSKVVWSVLLENGGGISDAVTSEQEWCGEMGRWLSGGGALWREGIAGLKTLKLMAKMNVRDCYVDLNLLCYPDFTINVNYWKEFNEPMWWLMQVSSLAVGTLADQTSNFHLAGVFREERTGLPLQALGEENMHSAHWPRLGWPFFILGGRGEHYQKPAKRPAAPGPVRGS